MDESAYSVIDKAIRENRHWEILLYVFSILVVGIGISAIIYGVLEGKELIALSGSISTSLIFPAVYLARNIRKQNIAIRLLEVPLNMAKTSEEAAKAISQMISNSFEEVFVKESDRKS